MKVPFSSPKLSFFVSLTVIFLSLEVFAWELPLPQKVKDPSAAVESAKCKSYPLEAEFDRRAMIMLQGLASESLDKWRKGYFSGGDPGKYLPCHAIAKLILNPADPEPAKYMNDDRSYKEHYHFAAVNWARFYPIFASVLTDETRAKFAKQCANYAAYLQHGGTENHKIMWWTSANVLPYYIEGELFAGKKKDEALAIAKTILKNYVKSLYAVGQGEWDSSTYLVFDVNGFLNIYDFSKDEECRLLAKAALDWYAATYALKYRDGVFCAPNQRGFSNAAFKAHTDQLGFLWWGGNKKLSAKDCSDMRYAIHAITSSYRPNKVITNIALKKIKGLPIEQKNIKPNYWHGQNIPPKPGNYYETFYMAQNYSMGSLWNGHGSQITRFQIVASSPGGAVTFTGGSPRKSDHNGLKTDFGYADGIGRYDQSIQTGPVYILMSKIPDKDEHDYVFFTIPDTSKPTLAGDWFVFEVDKTFLAVRALGAKAEIGETELNEKEKKENEKNLAKDKQAQFKPLPILKIKGRKIGFIVQTAEKPKFSSLQEFMAQLEKTSVETANFANGEVIYNDIDGRKIKMIFNPATLGDTQSDNIAECFVNDQKIDPKSWEKIYDGTVITQDNDIFTVSDGCESFTVDFSNDMPLYR